MSAEADVAVREHAEGTSGERLMLHTLANRADEYGICSDARVKDLAKWTGKTVRGAQQILRSLERSGQLVKLVEGNGRGNVSVYWIKLPGLDGPDAWDVKGEIVGTGKGEKVGTGEAERVKPAAPGEGSSPSPDPSPSSSTSSLGRQRAPAREAQLAEELRDAEVPDEMVADARSLLKNGRKVDRHLVTPAEMATAAAAVAEFNRQSGYDYGLGAHLTTIVMRIRERPSWDAAKHVRLIQSAFRFRWWETKGSGNRPTPAVVYGARCFEQVVQDATDEAAGKKKAGPSFTNPANR